MAGVHLALACQRSSGSTISSDLRNNIQQAILLGLFDAGASSLIFDKDISHLCKPDIHGRGFMQSGNDIIEVQTYFTQESSYVFDEDSRLSYDNPIFIEQQKANGKEISLDGFVKQVPLEYSEEDEDEDEDEDEKDEDSFDFDDDDEDMDRLKSRVFKKRKQDIEDKLKDSEIAPPVSLPPSDMPTDQTDSEVQAPKIVLHLGDLKETK